MRYDCLLVWGNGLEHIPGIVGMVREDPNFETVTIKRRRVRDMWAFVEAVYEDTTVTRQRLQNKAAYLRKASPTVVFTLLVNRDPDPVRKKDHWECGRMTALKMRIRNAYNPRYSDKNRHRPPLDRGVSHQHCVHGSDSELHAEHVLGLLNLRPLSWYKRYNDLPHFVPPHVPKVRGYSLSVRRVSELRPRIIGRGRVDVTDTPHYQYVCGNREPYRDYFFQHWGTRLCEDHFPGAFDRLIRDFELSHVHWDGRESRVVLKGDNVYDGVHRLAIAAHRGIEEVPCLQTPCL